MTEVYFVPYFVNRHPPSASNVRHRMYLFLCWNGSTRTENLPAIYAEIGLYIL